MKAKYCILIADDETLNYLFYREILSEEQYDIIYVQNGLEAISEYRANQDKIDLILMDMKMPDLDGFEATAEIRKFDKKIPIIAQTAYAFKEDIDKAYFSGCSDYISKPIHEDVLNSKINALLPK
jgi:CheY-like chemotaxis protein